MRAQQFTILRLCRAFSAKEVFMKQHLMRNINTISRCAALYRDAHLADCGLSGWQAPYIPEICAAPGITQDQLALRLHVNRSNVTRQLAMLEENGFVLRRRGGGFSPGEGRGNTFRRTGRIPVLAGKAVL